MLFSDVFSGDLFRSTHFKRERDILKAEVQRLSGRVEALEKEQLKYSRENGAPDYCSDFLAVWMKNPDFLADPRFMDAYRLGMDSGHKIGRAEGSKSDLHIEWRVHVCCWAAWHAMMLPGDFVECGVNTGILSLAVAKFIDFNSIDKSMFLFDTYRGIPEEQMSSVERALGREAENALLYNDCYQRTLENFRPFPKAHLVRGKVPDTLDTVAIDRVCYLSIDMNIVAPEIAAINYFWEKLSPGAPVILDDYGWTPFKAQKDALDEFATNKGLRILNLPTGQGLLLKP